MYNIFIYKFHNPVSAQAGPTNLNDCGSKILRKMKTVVLFLWCSNFNFRAGFRNWRDYTGYEIKIK
jgi:hypothetical protein